MTYTHWKKERKSIPFKKKMNQAEIKIGSRVWYRERMSRKDQTVVVISKRWRWRRMMMNRQSNISNRQERQTQPATAQVSIIAGGQPSSTTKSTIIIIIRRSAGRASKHSHSYINHSQRRKDSHRHSVVTLHLQRSIKRAQANKTWVMR